MSQGMKGRPNLKGRNFAVQSEQTNAGEHIRVLGELDLSVTGLVDREIRRAEATDAPSIVLDLQQLEFLDASGIRLLLRASGRSQADGNRLRIRRASAPQVERVLELTGVGEILPLAD
jgi:anti-anti-sigma factor